MISDSELQHLERCLELAAEALAAGDQPFGSVLVGPNGAVLGEDRNRTSGGDQTQHPEFEMARRAASIMTPKERADATVYTSTEHCPMCAAAHGWVGVGRIVYASSSAQLSEWLTEFGAPPAPIRIRPIHEIAPNVEVDGPVPELAERVYELQRRFHSG